MRTSELLGLDYMPVNEGITFCLADLPIPLKLPTQLLAPSIKSYITGQKSSLLKKRLSLSIPEAYFPTRTD